MRKSRLVFVPSPSMEQLNPAVELAKHLINHHHNLSITFLIIIPPCYTNLRNNVQSLTSSLSSIQPLNFLFLPEQSEPIDPYNFLHPIQVIDIAIQDQKENIKDQLLLLASQPDSPRIDGFVVDAISSSLIEVALDLNVPPILYFNFSLSFLGFMFQTLTLKKDANIDDIALTLDHMQRKFRIASFKNPVPGSVFPYNFVEKEMTRFYLGRVAWMKKAKSIFVNTFDQLEPYALRTFFIFKSGNVYPVGPIFSQEEEYKRVNMIEASNVMNWLDGKAPSSVVFFSLGDWSYFEDPNQIKEIAKAIESSGFHFVWSLLKPPPIGSRQKPSEYTRLEMQNALPEGFLHRTRGKGVVIGWAPEAQILAHKAVGGFVSSCGWNAILESVHHGVPIATWPQHPEQHLNAFLLVRELLMGVEISLDFRRETSDVMSAERLERGMRMVMEKESEVRRRVKHMSELCMEALKVGESSYGRVGRFIKEKLNE